MISWRLARDSQETSSASSISPSVPPMPGSGSGSAGSRLVITRSLRSKPSILPSLVEIVSICSA